MLSIPCSLFLCFLLASCFLQLANANYRLASSQSFLIQHLCSSVTAPFSVLSTPSNELHLRLLPFRASQSCGGELHLPRRPILRLHDERLITRGRFDSVFLRSDLPAGLRLLKAHFQGKETEEAVAQCTALPVDDLLRKVLTATSVSKLWGSLLHPPLSYREGLFEYRTADGSASVRIFRGPTYSSLS